MAYINHTNGIFIQIQEKQLANLIMENLQNYIFYKNTKHKNTSKTIKHLTHKSLPYTHLHTTLKFKV